MNGYEAACFVVGVVIGGVVGGIILPVFALKLWRNELRGKVSMMRFRKGIEPVHSSDFWYDLTMGGYIRPGAMLEEKADVEKVEEAIATVRLFLSEAERNGVLFEM